MAFWRPDALASCADGRTPKVEDAATVAGVSRTTAYRYFPNQTALLVAAHLEVGAESMLDVDAPADPRARLEVVVDRVISWLVEALDPWRAELGDDGVRRVAVAISSAIGIEALVWLVDILSIKVLRWSPPQI